MDKRLLAAAGLGILLIALVIAAATVGRSDPAGEPEARRDPTPSEPADSPTPGTSASPTPAPDTTEPHSPAPTGGPATPQDPTPTPETPDPGPPTPAPGAQLDVKFRSGSDLSDPARLIPPGLRVSISSIRPLYSLSDEELGRLGGSDLRLWHRLTLAAGTDPVRLAQELRQLDAIQIVQPVEEAPPPP